MLVELEKKSLRVWGNILVLNRKKSKKFKEKMVKFIKENYIYKKLKNIKT